MDPVKIQVSVVPDDEILHIQKRLTYLQEQYERCDRQLEGLRMQYSEMLTVLGSINRKLKSK